MGRVWLLIIVELKAIEIEGAMIDRYVAKASVASPPSPSRRCHVVLVLREFFWLADYPRGRQL